MTSSNSNSNAGIAPGTDAANQYCTFRVEDRLYGVPVTHVQEVIRYQPMTPVPLAHPCVRGLINLRGQIVTAVDLRQRLGSPPREGDALPMNVVVHVDGEAVSFLVDSIGDVLDVDPACYERPPTSMDGHARKLVTGVFKLPKELMLVVDPARAAFPN